MEVKTSATDGRNINHNNNDAFVFWMPPVGLFGEGDGTPLLYSCLENPRDGGAWWAAVYGVAQSWT